MTLHLNKNHILFQVERSEEVLKRDFLVTTKKTSPAELKKTFLEHNQRRFVKFLFSSRNKSCFFCIRYHKTSQTEDVKSQSTECSLRSRAQPKHDYAFEQKRRIVSSRENWGSSQNSFLVTTEATSPPELKSHFRNVLNVVLESFCFAQETKNFLQVFDITRHLKRRMERANVLIVAFENQRRQNSTLQSNKNR